MDQTREIFWSIGPKGVTAFYVIGIAAMGVFVWGSARHILKYARGRRLARPIEVVEGVQRMLEDVTSHRMLRRRDFWAGVAHQAVLIGFLIATAGTTIIFVDYDIVRPLLGEQHWRGLYYLATSLALDLGHIGLIGGLLYLIYRRAALHLPKLDYVRRYRGETELRPVAKEWRIEDWVFVLSLLVIEVTGFVQEGLRLHMEHPPMYDFSPGGAVVAKTFAAMGMSPALAGELRSNNWWFHGILALTFTAAFPWYKAKHAISVVGSLVLRDRKPLARLPRECAVEASDVRTPVGLAKMSDLSWKEMIHLDACTKCGRCHEACPARQSERPLSPRDFILDLRTLNDEVQGCDLGDASLLSSKIGADTLWACMSCGACQEICPVGIEHPPLIVQMRRHLVDQDIMDPQLRATFGNIARSGNSFGEPARKRPAWMSDLAFKVKDIREEPAEVLWFVGDYASFDSRNQKVSKTVASLLHQAGVNFALLHESEWNAGNDIRRAGEEGLYETLAEHNLEAMAGAKRFQRIITTDPHSYNTIKNEYPEFGEVAPIDHYSTVLLELIQSGRLKVGKRLGKRVTFHDPCHLGRLNKGYEPPRQVLEAIGCELVEMPRNRDNSFCCGAGGGRIWIPDVPGKPKPAISRMHEAAALGNIDVFVTCCPKDLTMYEDARKTSGHEKSFVVSDLAELVAEAIRRHEELSPALPQLIDRIVDAVANRIGDVVSARMADAIAQMPAVEVKTPSTLAIEQKAYLPKETESPAVEAPVPTKAVPVALAPSADEVRAPATQIPLPDLNPMGWDNLRPLKPAALPSYEVPPKLGVRILVLVKQVSVLVDEPRLEADGRDVVAASLEHALNEWDDAAIEEALITIENLGAGEVVVVTVGDESAEGTMRKALAKGVIRGVRVWSDELKGADPLTIARALAGICEAEKPDLIFCGVQSSDQANGATGIALAQILGFPHTAVVVGVEWDGINAMCVTRELEGGVRERSNQSTPAVVAVQSGINTPRYATMRMIKEAKRKPIEVVDATGVVDGSGGYVVRRMFVPEVRKAEMLNGSSQDVATFVANIIRKKVGSRA